LNPKLSIFFFAFLPQFASGLAEMIELSLVFMAVTFAVFAWMRRTFSGAFVALGARLALTER
jgi:threonine/homoserine/homoserine lactone efflux protein